LEQREVAATVRIGLSTLQRYLTNDDVAMFQERSRRESALTLEQREEIRVGIEHGRSDDDIAATICSHRSTVWRETARNGGRHKYRAALADANATSCDLPSGGWRRASITPLPSRSGPR